MTCTGHTQARERRSEMGNTTFRKATQLLCSPFSLAAMILLLVNDQLLRVVWPSWWTGKLGDFAWLFFFPFVLAAVLAWLISPRVPQQEKIVCWGAFGFTGGVFALAKTLPPFHGLLVRMLEAVLGVPVALVRDPSDLVALASLGMSWRFWQSGPRPASWRAAPGWAVLSCAALLTLANSVPFVGIDFVCSTRQLVYAGSGVDHWDYVSKDGGLSWQEIDRVYEDGDPGKAGISDDAGEAWPSEDEDWRDRCEFMWPTLGVHNWPEGDANVRYRFGSPYDAIERTEDGGQSWQRAFTPSTSQALITYYEERCHDSNCAFEPGPHSATVNPATGNVIFAMGLEGALVRTSSGEWVWSSVGGYSHVELGRVDVVFTLLSGEMLLAIGFALLSVLTLLRRLHTRRRRKILLVLFWIAWPIHTILMYSILHENFFEGVEALGYVLTFAACLVLAFLVLLDVPAIAQHAPDLLKRLAAVGLSVALLFLIPRLLWALGVVPEIEGVFCLLAPILGAVALFGGNRWTRDLVQVVRDKETADV